MRCNGKEGFEKENRRILVCNNDLEHLVKDYRTIAVVCDQWGDTGKGKFVDLLGCLWAEIVARGTGGNNAGHTVYVDGVELIAHLLPASIFHAGSDVLHIIGRGVAFDPTAALSELDFLDKRALPYRLMISRDAKLLLPQHKIMDTILESGGKRIGTTGRGIGPLYTDIPARIGLRVADLINPLILQSKLETNLRYWTRVLSSFDQDIVMQAFDQERAGSGRYYSGDENNPFNFEEIYNDALISGLKLSSFIRDADTVIQKAIMGKRRVLLEGAQGLLLSKEYGTYPYVTSSDCSKRGLAEGVGINEGDIDLTIGIVKAWYMTRVGDGPKPTEFGGIQSAKHCATRGVNVFSELNDYGIEHTIEQLDDGRKVAHYDRNHPTIIGMINSDNEYLQGIGVRLKGSEYGATTQRPRRTGWLDLPLLRYAITINGPDVALTKVDVLDGCNEIKICTHYEYQGSVYYLGDRVLIQGSRIDIAIPYTEVLENCVPIYKTFRGASREELVKFVERETGANVLAVSYGPERSQIEIR